MSRSRFLRFILIFPVIIGAIILSTKMRNKKLGRLVSVNFRPRATNVINFEPTIKF